MLGYLRLLIHPGSVPPSLPWQRSLPPLPFCVVCLPLCMCVCVCARQGQPTPDFPSIRAFGAIGGNVTKPCTAGEQLKPRASRKTRLWMDWRNLLGSQPTRARATGCDAVWAGVSFCLPTCLPAQAREGKGRERGKDIRGCREEFFVIN